MMQYRETQIYAYLETILDELRYIRRMMEKSREESSYPPGHPLYRERAR
jgi:hypothetical protein